MMRQSEPICEFMNWYFDKLKQGCKTEAYEELLAIEYGMGWLESKGWLNKRGREISAAFSKKVIAGKDMSRFGLIAVCVGIVDENWYCYKPQLRGFEEKDRGYVYIIIDDDSYRLNEGWKSLRFKVGFSKDPKSRLKAIRTANPGSRLFYSIQALKQTEKYVHETFSDVFVRIGKSEWFEMLADPSWELSDFEWSIKSVLHKASDEFFAKVSDTSNVRYPDYELLKNKNKELSQFIENIRHYENQLYDGVVRRMQDDVANDLPHSKNLDAYGDFVRESYIEHVEKDVTPPYRLLGEAYAVAYLGWHAR